MSLEVEMTSVFYVKKTLRFTVSNKFYLFKPGIKQISKYRIQIHKIMDIKMHVDLLYSITKKTIFGV